MGFDGIFLRAVTEQLRSALTGARAEKIYQPARDELLFHFRGAAGSHRLLLSAAPSGARVQLTAARRENPQTAPGLCMLLRKNLSGAKVRAVTQTGLDRVLTLRFDAYNEMGDPVCRDLVAELTGRHCNIIFTESGRVLDAVKRIDSASPTVRRVLPGGPYLPPPAQEKTDLFLLDREGLDALFAAQADTGAAKALLNGVDGLSPLWSREVVFRALGDTEARCADVTPAKADAVMAALNDLKALAESGGYTPVLLRDPADGRAVDFSFAPVFQYGPARLCEPQPDFTSLLDTFYEGRAGAELLRQRGGDVKRLLSGNVERVTKKMNLQRAELAESESRDRHRVFGEAIMANMYRIKPGDQRLAAEDFYGGEGAMLDIPLDPDLSPAENAQRYYRSYRKARTAAEHLRAELEKGANELIYLESALDALGRARTPSELDEIREELHAAGYIKKRVKEKKQKARRYHTFVSGDGYEILAGRNNLQNEELTLRLANRQDIWLHAKDMPGSHVIIRTGGAAPPEATLIQAAKIAAALSAGAQSENVPVDYTRACYVKKIPGGGPGLVRYVNQHTLYVTPDAALLDRLQRG